MFGKELVQQDIWLNLQKFIQVNKPASIPVHPCGRYRHNTVVFILAKVNDQLYLLLKEAWLQEHKLSLSWRSTFNIRIMARNLQIHLKNFQFEEKKLQEHGLKNLRTIHRLDRLTSGLLMFGR